MTATPSGEPITEGCGAGPPVRARRAIALALGGTVLCLVALSVWTTAGAAQSTTDAGDASNASLIYTGERVEGIEGITDFARTDDGGLLALKFANDTGETTVVRVSGDGTATHGDPIPGTLQALTRVGEDAYVAVGERGDDALVVWLRADGSVRWTYGDDVLVTSWRPLPDGVVVGTEASVAELDSTGEERWRTDRAALVHSAVATESTVYVADETTFVGLDRSDGTERWTAGAADETEYPRAAGVVDGRLVLDWIEFELIVGGGGTGEDYSGDAGDGWSASVESIGSDQGEWAFEPNNAAGWADVQFAIGTNGWVGYWMDGSATSHTHARDTSGDGGSIDVWFVWDDGSGDQYVSERRTHQY